MKPTHISDHDLERYYLGMIPDEGELAPLEEHILACPQCAERAEETQDYVDRMRAGLLEVTDPVELEMLRRTTKEAAGRPRGR